MDILLTENIFSWVVMPLLIFFARITDVTIGTLRIMYVAKGHRFVAPVLGFFEVMIWLVALTHIMKNLSNPLTFIAYGAGFAMGNYIGITIEEKLAVGVCIIRIITKDRADELLMELRKEGYGVTFLDAKGSGGQVAILLCLIKRADTRDLTRLIHSYNPKAFYSIEDVRFVNQGVFPVSKRVISRPLRKGK